MALDVVPMLNSLLSSEHEAWMMYRTAAYMAVGPSSDSLRETFYQHADEEAEHADLLARRIVALGGIPTTAVPSVEQPADAVACLQAVLKHEQQAIQQYTDAVNSLGDSDESLKNDLLNILSKETEHADEATRLLMTTVGQPPASLPVAEKPVEPPVLVGDPGEQHHTFDAFDAAAQSARLYLQNGGDRSQLDGLLGEPAGHRIVPQQHILDTLDSVAEQLERRGDVDHAAVFDQMGQNFLSSPALDSGTIEDCLLQYVETGFVHDQLDDGQDSRSLILFEDPATIQQLYRAGVPSEPPPVGAIVQLCGGQFHYTIFTDENELFYCWEQDCQ